MSWPLYEIFCILRAALTLEIMFTPYILFWIRFFFANPEVKACWAFALASRGGEEFILAGNLTFFRGEMITIIRPRLKANYLSRFFRVMNINNIGAWKVALSLVIWCFIQSPQQTVLRLPRLYLTGGIRTPIEDIQKRFSKLYQCPFHARLIPKLSQC